MSKNKTPRIGIGCWIFNPAGQVLLGLRLSPHGHGTWAPPGGKTEYDEMPTHCAARELREETGIITPEKKFHLVGITSDIYPDVHYITMHYRVDGITGEPKLMEPEKCDEWRWFSLDNLPNPLFLSAQNLLKTHPRI